MRIFTKLQLEWDGEKYVTDWANSEWHEYDGPIAECKGGASDAEKQSLANQTALFKTLSSDLSTTFGAQQSILNNLTAGWTPIFQAGINQYGFSPAEDSALRTQADTGVANNYQQARRATGETLAAVGGGNTFLPNGATAQLNAQNANAAAGQRSGENLGITQAGYETGRQNYLAAANALSGVSAQENPLGYAGAAGNANNSAFNMADTINKENQANSPWGSIGGILGGIAGSFLGPIGTAVGSKLGGAIGGGFGGGSGFGDTASSDGTSGYFENIGGGNDTSSNNFGMGG